MGRLRSPGHGILLGLIAVLVIAPMAGSTPWMMPRGDPQGTGALPEAGPAWPDVALNVTLPGTPSDSPPLILDGTVYVAHEATRDEPDAAAGVVAIDVDTGEVTQRVEIDRVPGADTRVHVATDGHRLYVAGYRTVQAYTLTGDGPLWTWAWEPRVQEPVEAQCRYMVIAGGALTLACEEQREVATEEDEDTLLALTAFVARLDADTGKILWSWTRDTGRMAEDAVGQELGLEGGQSAQFTWPVGLAEVGPVVVVQTVEGSGGDLEPPDTATSMSGGQARTVIRGLDKTSGDTLWSQASTTMSWGEGELLGGPGAEPAPKALLFGDPAAEGSVVYAKLGATSQADGEGQATVSGGLSALNPGTGQILWQRPLGAEDFDPGDTAGTGVSIADGYLFTTSAQTIYRIDADAPDARWATTLQPAEDRRFDEDPVVTADRVYTATSDTQAVHGTLFAYERETGDVAWTWSPPQIISFSVGDGLLAATPSEGWTLSILGQTEASPVTEPDVSEAFPGPGETVTVNLSESQAGVQGPITRYKAVWGDGAETPWQDDPVLTHAYNTTGQHTARFMVASDGGQSASTTQVFDVGGTEPNALEVAFQRENQDMTFGLLGLAVALGGGIIGVARRRRERARLQDELEALETGFEETRSNPGECEAFLETRKARARSLLLDGDLTEEQFGVIETRVAELQRELRTDILDDRLQFLPHGMVQNLKRMLADGRISSWERDAMEELLDGDETLSGAQKEKVRGLLDRWSNGESGRSG